MKNQKFIKVPHELMDVDISDGAFRLWVEINRFPEGNTSTNKMYADRLGISEQTFRIRLKELIDFKLISRFYKSGPHGNYRVLKVTNNFSVKSIPCITFEEYFKKREKEISESTGFILNDREKKDIEKEYEKLLHQNEN